ncbi:hypothetical protein WR25_00195 [Diploscapter pachys]|uniref:Uncharacterized protein n=1 Tax=Diploscapter pachys TaxID=2018661 RepID=A0A2A2J4G4_9BILA|nr:hypothetical protein WR25_00195 [Diploscapter pachys]
MCLMTCGKVKKGFKKNKASSINIKSPPSRRGKNSKRDEFKDDLDKDKDGDVKPDKVPSENRKRTGVKPKANRLLKPRYRQGHKTREDSVKIGEIAKEPESTQHVPTEEHRQNESARLTWEIKKPRKSPKFIVIVCKNILDL